MGKGKFARPWRREWQSTFGLLKWYNGKESTGNARDTRDLGLIFGFDLLQEDPLEKEMTTHYSILAWEIPWTEEPGELQSIGLQK